MTTASAIMATLGLKRHPTCGYVQETYRSHHSLPASSLPDGYQGPRPAGSALYFMVTTDAHIVMHRIRGDQIYHHYLGDPLQVLLLYPDGTGEIRVVGPDLEAGMRPQLLIPGGTFHMSRLEHHQGFALLGSSEWIGVEPPDVELGDFEDLSRRYPAMRDIMMDFMASAGSPSGPLREALRHREALLDEALKETFPGSDTPSIA
ncbi:cupin domain-containing protein [Chelatococcus asaccharovorans]|uniref:DUF985 domain-containing protein n=1 Tax=Chelatococcus asaccharovorans TaxID=28210 RepID=A0A2V3TYU7_9HYPH|nr:cupin domain-containing protein [Chelatococcus asaccharovorans]PXW54702.1 hypothetical protein C7450_111235 [Chelatococcus asaccharovorans]CAH1650296.1 Cupin_5 domain-containing protein [Chelatococcus asaccharovorans]CAH1686785.1 Cupin_5 domain-containing protein [Chelatococcus asaccharovorans]